MELMKVLIKSTSFNAYYNEYSADYFLKNVRSILEADDLSVVNFEGTLTEETSRLIKPLHLKGLPNILTF